MISRPAFLFLVVIPAHALVAKEFLTEADGHAVAALGKRKLQSTRDGEQKIESAAHMRSSLGSNGTASVDVWSEKVLYGGLHRKSARKEIARKQSQYTREVTMLYYFTLITSGLLSLVFLFIKGAEDLGILDADKWSILRYMPAFRFILAAFVFWLAVILLQWWSFGDMGTKLRMLVPRHVWTNLLTLGLHSSAGDDPDDENQDWTPTLSKLWWLTATTLLMLAAAMVSLPRRMVLQLIPSLGAVGFRRESIESNSEVRSSVTSNGIGHSFAFRTIVHKPVTVAVILGASCAALCVPSWYYHDIMAKPTNLQLFNTRLKGSQQKMKRGFADTPWSRRKSRNVVLIWNTDSTDLRERSAFFEILEKLNESLQVHARQSDICRSLSWSHDIQGPATSLPSSLKQSHIAPYGDAFVVHVNIGLEVEQAGKCFKGLRETVRQLDNSYDGLNVALASADAVMDASLEVSTHEYYFDLLVTAPFALGLLYIGVQSVLRVVACVITFIGSIICARGLMVIIKLIWTGFYLVMPDPVFMSTMLALCVLYSVYFWSRVAEEHQVIMAESGDKDGIVNTLKSIGTFIFMSTTLLNIAFTSRALYPNSMESGIFGASILLSTGVTVVALISLVTYSVLLVLAPRYFANRISNTRGSLRAPQAFFCNYFQVWGATITLRSSASIIIVSLCACLVPLVVFAFMGMTVDFSNYRSSVSETVREFDAHEIYTAKFGSKSLTPAVVLLEILRGKTAPQTNELSLKPEFQALACRFVELVLTETQGKVFHINAQDVAGVWWERGACSNTSRFLNSMVSEDGNMQLVHMNVDKRDDNNVDVEMVKHFWNTIEPKSKWSFTVNGHSYQFQATLLTSLATELLVKESYVVTLPWVLAFTVISTYCAIGYFLTSVAAWKMIVGSCVPVCAHYGLFVGIYQNGWLSWLGFAAMGGIRWKSLYCDAPVMFVMAILFNLFIFERVVQRRSEGYDNTAALRMALEERGAAMLSAGTAMIIIFWCVFMSSLPVISQVGCVYCFGVLMDAFVIGLCFAPVAFLLLEDMNYWPKTMPAVTKSYGFNKRRTSFADSNDVSVQDSNLEKSSEASDQDYSDGSNPDTGATSIRTGKRLEALSALAHLPTVDFAQEEVAEDDGNEEIF